jgi:hypothetical protein
MVKENKALITQYFIGLTVAQVLLPKLRHQSQLSFDFLNSLGT